MLNVRDKEMTLNLMEMKMQALENGESDIVIDLTNTALNNIISRRQATTGVMTKVPALELRKDLGWEHKGVWRSVQFNRMSRMMALERQHKFYIEEIKLKDGTPISVKISRPYLTIPGNPILYVDFCDDNKKNEKQHDAYLRSRQWIEGGIRVKDKLYEYCFSSASQLRTLSGVFIDSEYTVPLWIVEKMKNINIQYAKFLMTLKGAEAVWELVTSGAYSHHFTNKWAEYCGEEDLPPKKFNLSKFLARLGLALTSSIPFGRNWRVLKIGEIRFIWNEETEKAYREMKNQSGKPLYTEEEILKIKELWKATKSDGMTIIRASKVLKNFRDIYGKHIKREDVVGRLIQYRWAGVKGTGLIMADQDLDMCRDKNGLHVYKNYDIIVEANSWKFSPCLDLYTGDLAPEFELVAISKQKYSSNFTYQFISALDGNGLKQMINVLCSKVDAAVEKTAKCFVDAEHCKAYLGITQSNGILDEIGIDEEAMTERSKVSKALAVCDEVIKDKWFRAKILKMSSKIEEEERMGKISLDKAATRYLITDPIAFLRTDLMDDGGNIIITHPSQVALAGNTDVYWANKSGEAVLFRSPCVSPGEPQRVIMRSIDEIPETISTAYGVINVKRIFESIKDIIVIGGFSTILDALGGADVDGDTALIVYDEDIVPLRNLSRKTLLVTIPDADNKEEITPESVRRHMVRSLKNNQIGWITDCATTWRDLQIHLLITKKVDKGIASALELAKQSAIVNMHAPWAEEDPTIPIIAAMDTNNWEYIAYEVCNAALARLRMLQEMAINTAKSGIWVDFGTTDPDKNNHNHLALRIRASWHRPNAKITYKSNSVMGKVSQYVKDAWDILEKKAAETAVPILFKEEFDLGARYEKAFEVCNALRKHYGKEVYELREMERRREINKDDFNARFDALTSKIHTYLTAAAMIYGVDAVAVAAYDASNTKNSEKNGEGASFVWNCFFDELLDVLAYKASGKTSHKMMKVFIKPEYTYTAIGDVPVVVKDKKVFYNEVEIGTCNVCDGEYTIKSVKGNPYICVPTVKRTVEELNASMAGTPTVIIGLKYWKDLDGNPLTHETASKYLFELGKGIIKTELREFEGYNMPTIVCSTQVNGEWMTIGALPAVDKIITRALVNKVFRVKAREEKQYKDNSNRVPIEIVEMLADLNTAPIGEEQ